VSKTPRFTIFPAAALAALAFSASAQAAPMTLGSPLSAPVEPEAHCHLMEGCSVAFLKVAEPGAHAAATVSGAIVRWRVKGATAGAGYALSALRPNGHGSYTVSAGTAPIAAAGLDVQTFSSDMPIHPGELIALSYPYEAAVASLESPSSEAFFTPSLAIGQTRPAEEEGAFPYELGFNAEVQPVPTITAISPGSGPIEGGTSVSISGTDLEGATAVSFGGLAAASFTVNSESQITALVPAAPNLTALPITLTTPAGIATSPVDFTPTACVVPKLKGQELRAARKALKKASCALGRLKKVAGASTKTGRVTAQSPRQGTVLAPDAKISIKLAG
jgi:hypothetical protein